MASSSLVLVAGGTGRLGAPIVRALVAAGHRVRALTRDPDSEAAAGVAALGAEPVAGDFDDPESLPGAARGADAVVGAGTAHRAGPEGEARHGRNLADALAATEVPHFVYISGAGADAPSPVPVFESKRAVEEHIRDLDLPATIIAPVYLMENAFNPWNLDALRGGRFPLALPPQRSLQQVAIADVAAFAALAVGRRDELVGRRIEIASDEITGQQAATALTGATGRNFAFAEVPLHSLAPGLRALFAWLDRVGFDLDLASLHGRYPEVAWRSFACWAAEQAWDGRATPRPA